MRLPFGIDLKSVVITVAIIYFVLPFAMRMLAGRNTAAKTK